LKLESHKMLSTFAFNFNLRRHIQEAAITIITVVEATSARRALLATTRVDVEFAVAVSTEAGLVTGPPHCLLILYRRYPFRQYFTVCMGISALQK
jgi:hypothetical protein